MSRTFFLQEEMLSPEKAATADQSHSVAGLADAISGMDKEVLNEVILQVATSEEKKSDPDVRKIKLEVLTQQNEKIKEEQEEREYAKKKKESSEKISEGHSPASTEATDKTSLAAKAAIINGPIDVGTMSEKEILEKFDEKVEEIKEKLVVKAAELETGERELSAEEMEAISQLLSADPVLKEREDLARIKEAMREKIEEAESKRIDEAHDGQESDTASAAEGDEEKKASIIIETMEKKAAGEADKSTLFSTTAADASPDSEGDKEMGRSSSSQSEQKPVEEVVVEEEPSEDPVVARLKRRIESMVDKIELQLSDVHIKIGEKLHYLDKDMDGILSREEMAEVLSQVLKNISFEEALEIADGIVSVLCECGFWLFCFYV
jgi:hypothetical protein